MSSSGICNNKEVIPMNEKVFQVFVVEDNEWYNQLLVHTLSLNPDHQVHSYQNGKTAWTTLKWDRI
jgi:two-component system response regulator AtoC